MVDMNEQEKNALEHASDMAGEFLSSIGKTDLASMSQKEWFTLLDVVVTGFTDKLRETTAGVER